jgi:hypothetical protein
MAHHVAQTLTQAVDKVGGDQQHLRSLVDEIGRIDLNNVVGWRWWWIGIPAVDGFGINVVLPSAQLGPVLNAAAQSNALQFLHVRPIGVPVNDHFQAEIHLGAQGSRGGA